MLNLDLKITHSTGILIAIKDMFYSSICSFPLSPKVTCIDQLAVAVYIGNVKILIDVVYIPPGEDSKDFDYGTHADAINDLSSVYPDHELIIIGDYNLPGVTWKILIILMLSTFQQLANVLKLRSPNTWHLLVPWNASIFSC